MLHPSEAIAKVLKTAVRGSPCEKPLDEACFLVAARDVAAKESYPFFSCSAMDGYAVTRRDLLEASPNHPVTLPLAGEIKAVAGDRISLQEGWAIRIMTGGAVPEGADAVVKREDVGEGRDSVTFYHAPGKGLFINPKGEEIAKNEIIHPAGAVINPVTVGLLATLGIEKASVFPSPAVTLIVTGDELVQAGNKRGHGQVYDSVSPMLCSALKIAGVEKVRFRHSKDDRKMLSGLICRAARESKVVVTVGGVSVGDYDHIVPAMKEAGVEKIFWKVAQKPGKPLFFGKKGTRLFFGLPGNPASAMVCFLLYVLPALRKIMGQTDPAPDWRQGKLACVIENKDSRTQFIRGKVLNGTDQGILLEKAGNQASYMLTSFAQSDALIELPPGPVRLEAGTRVRALFWKRWNPLEAC